ncbi:MAG: hypothetical protein WDN00_11910 [Limisphaerales bacterium]
MTPQEQAQRQIGAQFSASGWVIQTKDKINLSAARGVAVFELSFATGEPDYTFFVDGKTVGTHKAKPVAIPSWALRNNISPGISQGLPHWQAPLPFL